MAPLCWFFCLCVLSASFLSSHGGEQDRIQLDEDEDVEAGVVAIAPWPIFPFSGERGNRQILWRPRPGREEEMPESSRSPPFAPRLGRYFVTTPRMGRRRS